MSELKNFINQNFRNQSSHPHVNNIVRGIEKEGLRISPNGAIAQTGHAAALGSTLTHPYITTDYSEALLEFITEPSDTAEDTIQRLCSLHAYTLNNIDDELVWPASMPCELDGDKSIPIALYGSSNIGTMKHVYRKGLDVRYGRIMQSIAGIHYNFSMPKEFWADFQKDCGDERGLQEFIDCKYFCLIRNYRKNSWLLNLLFGASPVVDESFFDGREHHLEKFGERTYGLEYATSLRMSDLGYQNSAQEVLSICFDSLATYTESLELAVQQKYPEYEAIGVKKNGEYQQLNSNILQLENEYYSDIRPKRTTESGEKPVQALRQRGVEYIEVRILDINPFLPVGIDETQTRFLDAFLLSCLLTDCSFTSETKREEIKENQRRVIMQGRDPDLTLMVDQEERALKPVAEELLSDVMAAAELFEDTRHIDAVKAQIDKINDFSLTPAGHMMDRVKGGEEFLTMMIEEAKAHRDHFSTECTQNDFYKSLPEIAKDSLDAQKAIEDGDKISFDEFLKDYHAKS